MDQTSSYLDLYEEFSNAVDDREACRSQLNEGKSKEVRNDRRFVFF